LFSVTSQISGVGAPRHADMRGNPRFRSEECKSRVDDARWGRKYSPSLRTRRGKTSIRRVNPRRTRGAAVQQPPRRSARQNEKRLPIGSRRASAALGGDAGVVSSHAWQVVEEVLGPHVKPFRVRLCHARRMSSPKRRCAARLSSLPPLHFPAPGRRHSPRSPPAAWICLFRFRPRAPARLSTRAFRTA
jgi:hypothetical protein